MSGFTKLHTCMLRSSVWYLTKEAKILWIALLLAKDRKQVVQASLPGLAHMAVLTLDETTAALALLTAPDKHSKNQEHEGRRVIKVEGGWMIVNGEFYRDEMSQDDQRDYNRKYMARRRGKAKKPGGPGAVEAHVLKAVEEGKLCGTCYLPFAKWADVSEASCTCEPE